MVLLYYKQQKSNDSLFLPPPFFFLSSCSLNLSACQVKIMTWSESIKLFLTAGSNISWGGDHSFLSVRSLNSLILQHNQCKSLALCVYFLGKGHGKEKSCSGFFFIMFHSDLDSRQVIQIQGWIYLKAELRQRHPDPICMVWGVLCCLYPCWPTSAGLTSLGHWFSLWEDCPKPVQNSEKKISSGPAVRGSSGWAVCWDCLTSWHRGNLGFKNIASVFYNNP